MELTVLYQRNGFRYGPGEYISLSCQLMRRNNMLSKARLQTIICTTRPVQAQTFYTDTLGLTLKGISDGALVFDVGGAELRVSPVPSLSPGEHTVVGFAVPDVDQCVARLKEKGVGMERFDGFPHETNGTMATPDGSRVAWFRDPDGNLLSVVQFR